LPAEDEFLRSSPQSMPSTPELQKSGSWVFAGGLYPPESSTVVRVNDGNVVGDGRSVRRVEGIHGWASGSSRHPISTPRWKLAERAPRLPRNAVQVRPFQDEPES